MIKLYNLFNDIYNTQAGIKVYYDKDGSIKP